MELSTLIKLVSCYYRSNCSPKQTLCLYRNETGELRPPCRDTSVTRLIQCFEMTGITLLTLPYIYFPQGKCMLVDNFRQKTILVFESGIYVFVLFNFPVYAGLLQLFVY